MMWAWLILNGRQIGCKATIFTMFCAKSLLVYAVFKKKCYLFGVNNVVYKFVGL